MFRKEREFCDSFGIICRNNSIEFRGSCIITSSGRSLSIKRYGEYLEMAEIPSAAYRFFYRIPFFCSLFRIRPVFSHAYGIIRSFRPDAVLWRFNITYVPWAFHPNKFHPGMVFITEHQAKEIEELRTSPAGRLLAPLVAWNRQRVLSHVDAVIGVTSEITGYECGLVSRNIPHFTLTNSIRVDDYPLKTWKQIQDNSLRLLYVGSHTAGWQGLDRVLRGMAQYHGDTNIELHVAGYVDRETSNLIHALGITDDVIVHGFRTGADLDRLFDLCDIAVGTLGMHRKNLRYGSTLKVREYMARGIPFIISHEDEDLGQTGSFPFVFNAPADDSPIDLHQVIRFMRGLSGKSADMSQFMRKYAQDFMDNQVKGTRLLEFIKTLLPLSGDMIKEIPHDQHN